MQFFEDSIPILYFHPACCPELHHHLIPVCRAEPVGIWWLDTSDPHHNSQIFFIPFLFWFLQRVSTMMPENQYTNRNEVRETLNIFFFFFTFQNWFFSAKLNVLFRHTSRNAKISLFSKMFAHWKSWQQKSQITSAVRPPIISHFISKRNVTESEYQNYGCNLKFICFAWTTLTWLVN